MVLGKGGGVVGDDGAVGEAPQPDQTRAAAPMATVSHRLTGRRHRFFMPGPLADRSETRIAAVDQEDIPRVVGAGLAGQIDGEAREIGGRAPATHRHAA